MKKILIGLGLVLILLVIALRLWQAEWKPEANTGLRFKQVELNFKHYLDMQSLPFAGASAFDVDGDGIDELFLGAGRQEPDKVFQFKNGKFNKMPSVFFKEEYDATYGAAHIDIDNDGDVDFITARESGVWAW